MTAGYYCYVACCYFSLQQVAQMLASQVQYLHDLQGISSINARVKLYLYPASNLVFSCFYSPTVDLTNKP